MRKRFSWIFLLVSGAFFVFIVGLTGYRIQDARKYNTVAAHEHAASIAAKVRSLKDITGSLLSPQFKTDMRDVFGSETRLLLLSIRSPQDGILYFIARNRSILKEPSQITSDWRGTPVYKVNRGSEILVSSRLESDVSGMIMDAIFVTMENEDLYPVVRDDLYLFLAFLLVCGVAILIFMSVQSDSEQISRESFAPRAVDASNDHPIEPSPESSQHGNEVARELTSPRTGLVWAEYFDSRLKAEIERAAASDRDLALAFLKIDEPFIDGRLPMAYVEVARLLTQSFALHDLIFEKGDDSYILLLPDTDVDTAVRLLEEFRRKLSAAPLEGRIRTVSIGVSSRGRLIRASILREEAETALAKASREGGNQVIGFRADAARFRETLTGTTA
jgi:GGDEF domain-containing protein